MLLVYTIWKGEKRFGHLWTFHYSDSRGMWNGTYNHRQSGFSIINSPIAGSSNRLHLLMPKRVTFKNQDRFVPFDRKNKIVDNNPWQSEHSEAASILGRFDKCSNIINSERKACLNQEKKKEKRKTRTWQGLSGVEHPWFDHCR